MLLESESEFIEGVAEGCRDLAGKATCHIRKEIEGDINSTHN